jgi:hypothetical protein
MVVGMKFEGSPLLGTRTLLHTMMHACASAARLRGGGPILNGGTKAMARHGTPPARTVIARPSRARDWTRSAFRLSVEMKAHAAGRICKPSGTMPCHHRQRASLPAAQYVACSHVARFIDQPPPGGTKPDNSSAYDKSRGYPCHRR